LTIEGKANEQEKEPPNAEDHGSQVSDPLGPKAGLHRHMGAFPKHGHAASS
jgi:hypothetical protein